MEQHLPTMVRELIEHFAETKFKPSIDQFIRRTEFENQVPLNAESEYQGGMVIYATRRGFLRPRRLPGSSTLHYHDVPHGISIHVGRVHSVRISQVSLRVCARVPACACDCLKSVFTKQG